MNEIPYPLKGDRLGRIIHLPLRDRKFYSCKEDALRWFFLLWENNEWWWLNLSPEVLIAQISSRPRAEIYAVQHFDHVSNFDEVEKIARKWRKSHAKERLLMNLLWHTAECDTFVYEEEDIRRAIECCLGIEITEPREKALVDRYPDLIKWTEHPGEAVLTRKGFEAIRKYLPPVSSPIKSFAKQTR